MPTGSIHNGHINYLREHVFFHGEETIAPNVMMAATQMKTLTDKDLLGRKKPEWTQSVSVPKAETMTYSFNHPLRQDKTLFNVSETLLSSLDPYRPQRRDYYEAQGRHRLPRH